MAIRAVFSHVPQPAFITGKLGSFASMGSLASPPASPEALAAPPRSLVLLMLNPNSASQIAESAQAAGLDSRIFTTHKQMVEMLRSPEASQVAAVVCALGRGEEDACWPVLKLLSTKSDLRPIFVTILSKTAARDVKARLECFDAGAKMVSDSLEHVGEALAKVASYSFSRGPYECPACTLPGLTEEGLRTHYFLHHTAEPNIIATCPICNISCSAGRSCLPVHLHNAHGHVSTREPRRPHYPAFAWNVCRRKSDGKFLLVNEPAGLANGRPNYWLPAGRVDGGESLVEACERECLEEAGVPCKVIGLLRFMVDNLAAPRVMRVVLLSEPLVVPDVEAHPKSIPNFESAGAVWADAQDLDVLKDSDYRHPDPADLYPKVVSGELRCFSIDTEAFRHLEDWMRRATNEVPGAEAELPFVWKAVREAYPRAAFHSHS
mmetsp:Transcript_10330/g.22794  ORF Transcript_10330/g.22794 Transcript_10330/m.22794 type:complete len:435 (-) Transcript_10330:454-1758(-)